MTDAMNIFLSFQVADTYWGKDAIYSINGNAITLHLKGSDDLSLIQCAAHEIDCLGIQYVSLSGENWNIERSWAFWMGYKNPKKIRKIRWANLTEVGQKELKNRLQVIDWVRDTINTPAEELGPEQLIQQAINLIYSIAKNDSISYFLFKGEELQKQNYMGIYTVGRGSNRVPAFLSLDYNPTGNKQEPIFACLVGKGITFDSGGYSIKQSKMMDSMKSDMGGAATVVGSLALAIARGLNRRIKLYLCCADNIISGKAFKPGDIIHYRNGKTVEVTNTDAEGRLVLADGLIDASMQESELIIDMGTLTESAKIALGNDYHALFSFDDDLVFRLLKSATEENERFWRLPLAEFHRNQLPSNFAELNNVAHMAYPAGGSTAAGFLSHFVMNYHKGWLHIDCSASYHKMKVEQWCAGATGLGVRSVANLLMSNNH